MMLMFVSLFIFFLISNYANTLNGTYVVTPIQTVNVVQPSLSFNGMPAINRILDLIRGIDNSKGYMGHPRDCNDIPDNYPSGVYMIYPKGSTGLKTYCEMTVDGGHWTVFQRRENGQIIFYRNWVDYEYGFGNPAAEFWLGNKNMNKITEQGKYELRIDLNDFDGNIAFAKYEEFSIGDEQSNYNLTANGYSGTAGDSLVHHNGQGFSTKDRDNDNHPNESCARYYKGAWWFNKCVTADLNGDYYIKKPSKLHHGVYWDSWKGYDYSLKSSVMMMRRLE